MKLTLVESSFVIKNVNKVDAAKQVYKIVANCLDGKKSWEHVYTLEEMLRRYYFTAICSRETGDITDLKLYDGGLTNLENLKELFEAIAPFVEEQSYIDFVWEQPGSQVNFTYLFKDGVLYDMTTPEYREGTLIGVYNTAGGSIEYKFYQKKDKFFVRCFTYDCDKNIWVKNPYFPLHNTFYSLRNAMIWLADHC